MFSGISSSLRNEGDVHPLQGHPPVKKGVMARKEVQAKRGWGCPKISQRASWPEGHPMGCPERGVGGPVLNAVLTTSGAT
jgi:hypothetical protein